MATLSLLHYSLIFFASLLLTFKLLFIKSRRFRNIPPGPLPLPIIGNLHQLEKPLHLFFQRMSQKHGHIFSFWFGSRLAIIISSSSAFQECFTKNDVVLANRPHNLAGKHIFYNCTTVGTSSYGDHWQNLRRIISLDVLSTQRVHSFWEIRRDETNRMIQKLAKFSSLDFAHVELSSMFQDMMYNNMMRMVSGKGYYGEEDSEMKEVDEAREFRETVEQLLQLAGLHNMTDYLPFLKWFDYDNVEKRLKNISERFDTLLNSLIHEHRSKQHENTMIGRLLSLQESQPEYYNDQIIKGLVLAMLFAGTGSSALTLEWALTNVLNHPSVLKRARDELDIHIGQDRLINESDLSKLPYLNNIILETLRLYPPAPLLIPHVSSNDITIGGFNVPRDTIVIVNGWDMQRDPQMWSEATTFKPERFEKEGEEKKLIAFGLGRRACPGESMAMRNVGLTLGLLIQCFDWKRPSSEEIDMQVQSWFNLIKLIPLKALCKARPVINKALK